MGSSRYPGKPLALIHGTPMIGHVAFRTPADEEKWKARQQEKRDALRAAKAQSEETAGA